MATHSISGLVSVSDFPGPQILTTSLTYQPDTTGTRWLVSTGMLHVPTLFDGDETPGPDPGPTRPTSGVVFPIIC